MVDYGGMNASEHDETVAQNLLDIILRDHAEAMKRQESEMELAIQARKQEAAKAAEKMNELTSLIREQEDEIKEQKRDLEHMQEMITIVNEMNMEHLLLIGEQEDEIKKQKRDLERMQEMVNTQMQPLSGVETFKLALFHFRSMMAKVFHFFAVSIIIILWIIMNLRLLFPAIAEEKLTEWSPWTEQQIESFLLFVVSVILIILVVYPQVENLARQ